MIAINSAAMAKIRSRTFRLLAEPMAAMSATWSSAGAVLATVRVFAMRVPFGEQVAECPRGALHEEVDLDGPGVVGRDVTARRDFRRIRILALALLFCLVRHGRLPVVT